MCASNVVQYSLFGSLPKNNKSKLLFRHPGGWGGTQAAQLEVGLQGGHPVAEALAFQKSVYLVGASAELDL